MMSDLSAAQLTADVVRRYLQGVASFPYFVLELGQVVSVAEEQDSAGAKKLRRIWGQLEIINALALDEGIEVAPRDEEVNGLILEFLVSIIPLPVTTEEGAE